MRLMQFLLVPMAVLCFTMATEDREDWIDPHDLLNYDPASNRMLKKEQMKTPDLKQTEDTTDENQPLDITPPSPTHEASQDIHNSEPSAAGDANQSTDNECKCPSCEQLVCPEPQQCNQGTCPVCKLEPCLDTGGSDKAAVPLLKQYIAVLLKHINDQVPLQGSQDYMMHVTLTADRITILERFVKGGNKQHVHDVHEVLGGMIHHVASSNLSRMEKMALWLENKIGLKLDRLIQFFMLVALASIVLLVEVRIGIPWRKRVGQLIILMFVVSIPWTWLELYKQAEIKQQSMATRTTPSECENGEQDYWTSLKSYFTLQDDKCLEYYEHLMIDPVIKVPPTKAIGVTFVRFFVAPLKDVGAAMSEFIRALLIDLPLTLYPIAIAMVSIFLFMILFMWFGYSIRLPFFLTIERSPAVVAGDSGLHQALQDSTQQTKAQLEKLQERLVYTESELTDRLNHLQRTQEAAIEYNVSSDSPVISPTISVKTPTSSASASPTKVSYTPAISVSVSSTKQSNIQHQNRPVSPTKQSSIPKPSFSAITTLAGGQSSSPPKEELEVTPRSRLAQSSRLSPRKANTRPVKSCDNNGQACMEDSKNTGREKPISGKIKGDADIAELDGTSESVETLSHCDTDNSVPNL
ncbi:chloride channel CLIC-like protein 1 isoform X1 [Mya arenaria]|uniref:chloride channel CLIC-like protein 1 isoform X1 n=1 Tax=Mya arenaria TaxID=6604 RepID=UPI0022E2D068|nr:chloride channel CLIC-like protein 1 isoform X1 [Mya arenaria]XP_052774073.1 chloride channel CLIC-like protein 1 isoform X1 [Mya arenaria]